MEIEAYCDKMKVCMKLAQYSILKSSVNIFLYKLLIF